MGLGALLAAAFIVGVVVTHRNASIVSTMLRFAYRLVMFLPILLHRMAWMLMLSVHELVTGDQIEIIAKSRYERDRERSYRDIYESLKR